MEPRGDSSLPWLCSMPSEGSYRYRFIHICWILICIEFILHSLPWRLPVGLPRLLLLNSALWQDQRLLLLGPRGLLRDLRVGGHCCGMAQVRFLFLRNHPCLLDHTHDQSEGALYHRPDHRHYIRSLRVDDGGEVLVHYWCQTVQNTIVKEVPTIHQVML